MMKRMIIVGLTAFIWTGLQPAVAQTGEALFEEALRNERAEGNLEAAIALYQQIVDEYGENRRELAAHALVRLGQSYEKLGRDLLDEAREAYEQVLRDYGDQPERVAEARRRLTALHPVPAPSPEPVEPRGLTVRRITRFQDFSGQPSPDGRYISYINWRTGNLAVYDVQEDTHRDLTDE